MTYTFHELPDRYVIPKGAPWELDVWHEAYAGAVPLVASGTFEAMQAALRLLTTVTVQAESYLFTIQNFGVDDIEPSVGDGATGEEP